MVVYVGTSQSRTADFKYSTHNEETVEAPYFLERKLGDRNKNRYHKDMKGAFSPVPRYLDTAKETDKSCSVTLSITKSTRRFTAPQADL